MPFSQLLNIFLLTLTASSALSLPSQAPEIPPSLHLAVSGPTNVTSLSDFKINTTLTNTGNTPIKILRHPQSILSDLPSDKFKIATENGTAPKFIGIRAKYVAETAMRTGKHTKLNPGESITVEHDLSKAYDISGSEGEVYTIEPSKEFHVVSKDSTSFSKSHATFEAPHRARVSTKLRKPSPSSLSHRNLNERDAQFFSCSDSQINAIREAIPAAQNYASQSLSYLQSKAGYTPRTGTWFGHGTLLELATLKIHYSNLNSAGISNFQYDCSCNEQGVYAFVYPDQFGRIYLCPSFWAAPTTGTDSKAGTIIHESSHFNKLIGTGDHAYGQDACRQLAKADPPTAAYNADSHEYFAENNPFLN